MRYESELEPGKWPHPRRAHAGAGRRRRLLAVDLLLGVCLAAIILIALPGLGVVAWFALPLLLIGLAWLGVEQLVARRPRRPGA